MDYVVVSGRSRVWAMALIACLGMVSCASDNEHFCAKYSYYYRELTAPGLIPYPEIERQLRADLNNPDKDPDRSRIALFVLRDIVNEVKPGGESAQDYCMRRKLWERYH